MSAGPLSGRGRASVAVLALVAVVAAAVVLPRLVGSLARSERPVWSDEFAGPEGAAPADHWTPAEGGGGWGNEELQTYTSRPENVALDGDGHLRITARRESDGSFTSARLQSTAGFVRGRIEARIRVPAGAGLWSAFWTLGAGGTRVGWPRSGEIDVMEVMNDTRTVNANVHVADAASPDGRGQAPGLLTRDAPLADGWHVYGLEWSRERLVFTLDGREYHRITRGEVADWPFDEAQVLLLNLAVGGRWPGPPDASTPFPATMLVDWVRVYPEA
ncbi:MAG: glycoside hydrolase family 16 protein [Thermoleophilia bacterium]